MKDKKSRKGKIMEYYSVTADDVPAKIKVRMSRDSFVPIYEVTFPELETATVAVMDEIREELIMDLDIKPVEVINPDEMKKLKERFMEKTAKLVDQKIPHLSSEKKRILAGILMHKSLGLGSIEILLKDSNLEEIVINGSKEPVWVYHRKLGWLKTNLVLKSETEIYNYSSQIGRRVGTQITNLSPLMDAYLTTGDRANATMFPISSHGNTLTIRKFSRKPWTITDFIKSKTLSLNIAAFLWLAMQYEMNILISGGTASGKTALLNVLTCFIPPNQRVITIEDTREMRLPEFLHWVPMTTRPPNPEGKGEITMLNLMVNALRMRPDRMIVGEIRRSREAEVLFEAIHTGHSVYATIHSNTADETLRRLTNPPINIPNSLLMSLDIIVAMHRDRRRDIRRVLEVMELVDVSSGTNMSLELNQVFRWSPSKDSFMKMEMSRKVIENIKIYTGMSDKEIEGSLKEKKRILQWMVDNSIDDIDRVGKIISEYYVDPDSVMEKVKGTRTPGKK
ncbi:MAG: CpaF family protein [Candidatus Aenigmatarchaeota archaeon]|nr:MAG: CpaF family protein [Candidatus Aenigmarchaeota archaeon]